MSCPKVSVIIPAYNDACYLGEAIQSVLDQTYPNFEVIVVNDASIDHTHEVVNQFSDPRLKYIVHDKNRMLAATRNTGIRASDGEIIALLDADDMFHPQKLLTHVEFLEKHPEVNVTYNARFNFRGSAKVTFELSRPPLVLGLSDLVLGFPFAPSDMVLRRTSAFEVGLFDESYTAFSEDLDFNCRLALAGCRFAGLNRALNYRRFHPGRIIGNIPDRLAAHLRALERVFSDPACPLEVAALRESAYTNKYLAWAGFAFLQKETGLGQSYVREAVRLQPSILEGNPCELLRTIVSFGVRLASNRVDLGGIVTQLPIEIEPLFEKRDSTLANGYLLRGTNEAIWGRQNEGRASFAQASALGAEVNDAFLQQLAYELCSYEIEFGPRASLSVLRRLEPLLARAGSRRTVGRLRACFSVQRAFESYRSGDYTAVPGRVVKAIASDPKYLANRGVLAILLRSFGHAIGLGHATC